jgi:hypothetical protein
MLPDFQWSHLHRSKEQIQTRNIDTRITLQISGNIKTYHVYISSYQVIECDSVKLVSFERGDADWKLLGLPKAAELPAVRWRQENLNKLTHEKRALLDYSDTTVFTLLGLSCFSHRRRRLAQSSAERAQFQDPGGSARDDA